MAENVFVFAQVLLCAYLNIKGNSLEVHEL